MAILLLLIQRRMPAGRSGEHLGKEAFSLALSLLGQDDRLRLSYGIGDEALLVQPLHRVPIEPLPHATAVMQTEQEQRENRRVHALGIDLHRHRLPNATSD